MRTSSIALIATLLVGIAPACSDDQGSTVEGGSSPRSYAGNSSSHAGSSTVAGSAGRTTTTAGTSSENGLGGSSSGNGSGNGDGNGNAPTNACRGLPFEVNAVGGATDSAGAGGDADEACNGVSVEAEAVPVDVFVIMDRSQSMGLAVKGSSVTRWQALHEAVKRFTEDPKAADIQAGIGFFSVSGGGDDAQDCDADAYAEPNVSIGPISEVGPDLAAAMDGVTPGGLTPTVPALQGAISYARSWARDNKGRATIVALVTDGYPTQCSNDPTQISEAARSGYQSAEHIRTFVIGVGDVAQFNLDNYARAGGTQHAYLTDAGDVTASFVDALDNITNRALACEYQLPPPPDGMKLDTTKVQIVYTPASGEQEEVPSVPSLGACTTAPNGGWYYDDANQPSKITVCPCTCARFQAGRVDVRLGCKPRLGLR